MKDRKVLASDGLHVKCLDLLCTPSALFLSSLRSEFPRAILLKFHIFRGCWQDCKSKNRLLENQLPNPIGLGSLFFEERVLKPSMVGYQLGGGGNCMFSQSGSSTHKNQLLSLCSMKTRCSICQMVPSLWNGIFVTRDAVSVSGSETIRDNKSLRSKFCSNSRR